ncbi:glycosyltransferase [Alsobacter sp. SYSU BS001988]|jgi:glycosyltransferase involved in cell wall biosynthesis
MISVVIPARNEGPGLANTVQSIVEGRRSGADVEIVIADDVSRDGCCRTLAPVCSGVAVRVVRSKTRLGVPRARNLGVAHSRGELLLMTDGHVSLEAGWDIALMEAAGGDRIAAGSIVDAESGATAYGCRLVTPHMGTFWNAAPPAAGHDVQIASAAATGLTRALFDRIGGYDEGMRVYGAAEPEFSVRAWLSGAEVACAPKLRVTHRFKGEGARDAFLARARLNLVHNNLRFGLCYLSETASLEMVRYYALKYPRHFRKALTLVAESDVWSRRAFLKSNLKFDFQWFVDRFDLRDQIGRPLARRPKAGAIACAS